MNDIDIEDEEYIECEFCGFQTDDIQEYRTPNTCVKNYFCPLCASTFGAKSVVYGYDVSNKDILQTVCYIGNSVLEQLNSLNYMIRAQQKP